MRTARLFATCLLLATPLSPTLVSAAKPDEPQPAPSDTGFEFINTAFENASPLYWQVEADGTIDVYLMYDHERSSTNRAAGHWHFQVQARKGSDLTIVLNDFDNVWNGKSGSPVSKATIAFLSQDGKQWRAVPLEYLDGNRLKLQVHMDGDSLYVARLEPYRLSDLAALKSSIRGNPLVEITTIGQTVEGRELEIIRVGRPDAPFRVFLRARAHAWEPGGNWIVEGIVGRLLAGDADARRYLDRYAVYMMPMANKDGVARGRTRFNLLGKDLNRNWDQPADPRYCPENVAVEKWVEAMIAQGKKPDLAIDFHNDEGGRLHISRPEVEVPGYLKHMERLERLLRQRTWFTEGSTGATFRNAGTIGEGLLVRYGITACVHELNANRIAGLNDYPSAKNWKLYGRQLCQVFYEFFEP